MNQITVFELLQAHSSFMKNNPFAYNAFGKLLLFKYELVINNRTILLAENSINCIMNNNIINLHVL